MWYAYDLLYLRDAIAHDGRRDSAKVSGIHMR